MSLMGMNRAFKKHGAWLGGGAAALMLVVALSGLGANTLRGGSGPADRAATAADAPVATVGDLQITRPALDQQIDRLIHQQMSMMPPPSPAEMDRFRYLLLNQYKDKAALALAAKAAGVTISDDDMSRERDKAWALQRGAMVSTLGLPAKATDADVDKALATQQPGATVARYKQVIAPDDQVRTSLYQQGLINQMKKQVQVNEDQVKKSYDGIQVRHILVKSGAGGLPDAQAKVKAEGLLAQVKADPSKMAQLAQLNSDDPGSKAKGGFYDWAQAGKYVPEFTQGALAAGVGKVNPNLIKTSYGYHIIKLEGERPGQYLPKDWDKNKQKYIDEYVEQQAQGKAKAAVDAQIPNIKVTILDHGMRAAQLEEEARAITEPNGRNAKLNEALGELNKITKGDDRLGAAPLRRAAILMQLNRTRDAIAAYEDALTYRNSVESRLALADLYQGQKDKVNALKQVEEARKLPVSDVATEFRIATLLDNLGAKDEAEAARKKAADMAKRQAQMDAAARASQMPPIAVPTAKGSTAPTTTVPSGTTTSAASTPAAPAPSAAASAATTASAPPPASAAPTAPSAASANSPAATTAAHGK